MSTDVTPSITTCVKTVVDNLYAPVPLARRIWELDKLAILALALAFWL